MDNPISDKNKQGKDTNKKRNTHNKLSYKLKLELDALPETIEKIEKEIEKLEEQTSADGFYSKPYEEQQPILDELNIKHKDLDTAIRRWDELTTMEKELQSK